MNARSGVVESTFVAGVTDFGMLPPPALAEVAFAGRSNVGKSSLLNALLGRRKLARVGRTPGTTRQLNFFRVRSADGLELVLVDLPGYGFAQRGKAERAGWGPLVESYLTGRVTLRAVVLLVDVRRGVEKDERDLVDFVRATGTGTARRTPEIVIVATKIDKVPASRRKLVVSRLGDALGGRVLGFSAASGEGKEELWKALRDRVTQPDAAAERS
jgi:GTP-binding protein